MPDKKEPAPVVAPAEAKPAPFAAKPEPVAAPKPAPKAPEGPTDEELKQGEADVADAYAEAAPAPGRGAQVILDGAAQTAARGAAAPDMAGNLAVKEALEGSGEVADGTTPDGSTLTGKPAPDVAT